MMRKGTHKLLIIMVGLWLFWPMFGKGLPVSHDGQNHLARMANYYLSVRQGNFPPRWAANLNAGFGYPVLNFNYPLAYMLGVPFIAVNFGIENTYKLLLLSGYLLGGLGMYAFLGKHFKAGSAWFGAILYITAPYQLTNLFVRGNIGEILSLSLLPWTLYYIDKVIKKGKAWSKVFLTLVMAGLWLSHNLMVLLSVPVIILYIAVIHGKKKTSRLIGPVAISLLLVSFFWTPALGEMNKTIMSNSPLNRNYIQHFATVSQILFSPLSFGFSEPGPVDGMTFNIGIAGWVIIFLSLLRILKNKKFDKWWGLFFGLVVFGVFMMLSVSELVWSVIPLSGFMQFPWRMLFIVILAVAGVGAHWFEEVKSKGLWVLLLAGNIVLLSRAELIKERFAGDDLHWMGFPLTTTVSHENDPLKFARSGAFNYFSDGEKVKVKSGKVEKIQVDEWLGWSHAYKVELSEDSLMVERVAYFPGWEVYADGEEVDLSIDRDITFGLVSYWLPAGKHKVTSMFTQRTIWRIMGNSLSVVGMIALYVAQRRWTKKQS